MTKLPTALRKTIQSCGYFPDFIEATVSSSLGSEEAVDFVVHHEAIFGIDEIHRHLTVLILTPTRLIVNHTDDGELPGAPQALSTVETVPLRKILSVAVTNVVANPAAFKPGQACDEVWLTVAWNVIRRLEITPASCGDPVCDADHGYDAQDFAEDLTLRMSVAADGEENVASLSRFATSLQRVVS